MRLLLLGICLLFFSNIYSQSFSLLPDEHYNAALDIMSEKIKKEYIYSFVIKKKNILDSVLVAIIHYNKEGKIIVWEQGYDAQIGRFTKIDPLADSYTDWSPYCFAFDDPVFWNDPLGAEPDPSSISTVQDLIDYINQYTNKRDKKLEKLKSSELIV